MLQGWVPYHKLASVSNVAHMFVLICTEMWAALYHVKDISVCLGMLAKQAQRVTRLHSPPSPASPPVQTW